MARYPYINPSNALAVTPSNTVDLGHPSRIYCGGTGNVKVNAATNSAAISFNNVPAGTTLDLIVKRVWTTGTTCSGIVAMW